MEISNSTAPGKRGIGKLVDKFKTALRKGSTSRASGQPSNTPTAQQSSAPAQEQLPDTTVEDSEVQTPEAHVMRAPTDSDAVIEPDTFDPSDRTQVLLARYNLDIGQPKWPAHKIPHLERVSKPVRMRVRYTCHRCKTSFGHDKECSSCRHRRCARCDRYPPRTPRQAPESQAAGPAPVVSAAENAPKSSDPVPADHICTCHECQTVVELEVEHCPNCHHTICDRCHKEAQIQFVDAQTAESTMPTGEAERKAPPEEQKLPPDIGTAEEQQQPGAT